VSYFFGYDSIENSNKAFFKLGGESINIGGGSNGIVCAFTCLSMPFEFLLAQGYVSESVIPNVYLKKSIVLTLLQGLECKE
jgi:hypothetical protein